MLKSHLRITRFATATFQFKKKSQQTHIPFLKKTIVNTCFIRKSFHTFIFKLNYHYLIIKFCTRIPHLFYYKFQSSYLYRPFLVRVQISCTILCTEGILRHRFYRFFWTLLMNILLENTVNHENYNLNCLELPWKFNYKKWLF
jgi:hypothetical protein